MAGLNISGLAGAAANAVTALSKEKGLDSFLKTVSGLGIQVKNNFEVNFSGIPQTTFFVQSIDVPGLKQNTASLNYDGKHVDVPVNHEYEHNFSMTVLNDANGYIYSALSEFLVTDASNQMANSGYTITIRSRNGNDKWPGALITMRGVRITQLGGLQFGQSDTGVQTFSISGTIIDFSHTPGAAAAAAGIAGTLTSILG